MASGTASGDAALLISVLFGFAAGVAVCLLFSNKLKQRTRPVDHKDSRGALNTPQLLAWIDAATQGWLILKPDLTIAYINARAERLLHLSRNLLVRGLLLGDVLSSAYQQAQLDMGIFSPKTVSVGDLFMGALVPGLLLVVFYMI